MQRAQEAEKVDPKTACYARMTAVTEGMDIEHRDPHVTAILGSVMGKLEATKATAQVGDEALDKAHVTQFCLKLFTGADRCDRAGRRDEGVLKRCMHCKILFNVRSIMCRSASCTARLSSRCDPSHAGAVHALRGLLQGVLHPALKHFMRCKVLSRVWLEALRVATIRALQTSYTELRWAHPQWTKTMFLGDLLGALRVRHWR